MANQYGLFWNSESGDRKYGADNFAEWLRHFFTTGVFTGECAVTAADGMAVSMASGYANIEGKVRLFESATSLEIAAANASYPRIDTVVIRCSYTNREITAEVVQGGYNGTSPQATAPVRNAEMYELVVAQIYVGAGVTKITQANITDKRADTSVCGIVAATVKQIDFSQIQKQYDSFIANYKNDVKAGYEAYSKQLADAYNSYNGQISDYEAKQEAEFGTWFSNIKATLGSDTAGELQNEIDDLADDAASRTQKKTTVFDGDTIKETLADGRIKITVFSGDTITETLKESDGTTAWVNKTTFNADGSITETKEA